VIDQPKTPKDDVTIRLFCLSVCFDGCFPPQSVSMDTNHHPHSCLSCNHHHCVFMFLSAFSSFSGSVWVLYDDLFGSSYFNKLKMSLHI